MELNRDAIRILESELPEIEAQLDDIRERIADLEAHEAALQFKQEMILTQVQAAKMLNGSTKKDEPRTLFDGIDAKEQKSLKGLGFREAIRHVLMAYEMGLPTGEIGDKLLEGGYDYTGNLHLSTRISNELTKMAKAGHLKKFRRRGKVFFSLNQQDGG